MAESEMQDRSSNAPPDTPIAAPTMHGRAGGGGKNSNSSTATRKTVSTSTLSKPRVTPSVGRRSALNPFAGKLSSQQQSSKSKSAKSASDSLPEGFVLVRSASNDSDTPRPSDMRGLRRKGKTTPGDEMSALPALDSFSFENIMSSIDPEVKNSIDAIAEICGRSKLSLASEHGSHLPPQGTLSIPIPQDHFGDDGLDTIGEQSILHSPGHARSQSVSLVLPGTPHTSSPTAATSHVTSETHAVFSPPPTSEGSHRYSLPEAHGSQLSNVISWLNSFGRSQRDKTASDALLKILGETARSSP